MSPATTTAWAPSARARLRTDPQLVPSAVSPTKATFRLGSVDVAPPEPPLPPVPPEPPLPPVPPASITTCGWLLVALRELKASPSEVPGRKAREMVVFGAAMLVMSISRQADWVIELRVATVTPSAAGLLAQVVVVSPQVVFETRLTV